MANTGVWTLDEVYLAAYAGTWDTFSSSQAGHFAAGYGHSLARRTDGTLWTWGYNSYGGLGDGTLVNKSSPVQVPGTLWVEVAAGYFHSLARRTDGTLWTWGHNIYGQLGDGTIVYKSSPVQVPGTNWA